MDFIPDLSPSDAIAFASVDEREPSAAYQLRLRSVCAMCASGFGIKATAETLGITPSQVARALNSPLGKTEMLRLAEKREEMAIDKVKQRLKEVAEEALEDYIGIAKRSESDAVRAGALREILYMAGYKPAQEVKVEEKIPTVVVGAGFGFASEEEDTQDAQDAQDAKENENGRQEERDCEREG